MSNYDIRLEEHNSYFLKYLYICGFFYEGEGCISDRFMSFSRICVGDIEKMECVETDDKGCKISILYIHTIPKQNNGSPRGEGNAILEVTLPWGKEKTLRKLEPFFIYQKDIIDRLTATFHYIS